jgi:hypothetical protein
MNLDDIIDRNQDKAPPPEGRAEVCMDVPSNLTLFTSVEHAPELENDPAWQKEFGTPAAGDPWVSAEEAQKLLDQGDAFSSSNFDGFPDKPITWETLLEPMKPIDWNKVTPWTNKMRGLTEEVEFTMEGRYEPPAEEVPIVVTVTTPDGKEAQYIANSAKLSDDGKTLTMEFSRYTLESFQPADIQDGSSNVEIGTSDPDEDCAPQGDVGTWSHQVGPVERAAAKAGAPAGLFEGRPPNPELMSTQEHATWLEAAERSRRRLGDKLIRPFIEDVIRCFETVDPDDVKPDAYVDEDPANRGEW